MKAWRVQRPGSIDGEPLKMVEEPPPRPGIGEILLAVDACAVCRTDLHVVEGDLPVHLPHVVPGHEIVGTVVGIGPETKTNHRVGDVVGAAWLRNTCGICAQCLSGRENLCRASLYTGWDRDGGFAEFAVVPADYVLELPRGYSTIELAPLLCAGIIGYRALACAGVPSGGRLGLYGFGASAHIVAQLAVLDGARVHVMTRGSAAQELARSLGAVSAQGAFDAPPEKLDSAIVFAPVGTLVPTTLEALDSGGTAVLAGIYMSDIPTLDYQLHLFHEKKLRSVESYTRADARAFLARCDQDRIHLETTTYDFDGLPAALRDLRHGRFAGAAVISM